MKKIKLLFALSLLVPAAALANGCGDDDNGSTPRPDAGNDVTQPPPDTGTPDTGGGPPPPPAIGAQVDRFGRPAVNTAVNNTFAADTTAAGVAKDQYNANGTPSAWVAAYRAEIAKNLAIYDSLDSICGNQPLAQADGGANRYAALAGVLADDRLWVNTGATACDQYLGVELNATGLIPNNDCGGRSLGGDVIDLTYGVVAGNLTPGVATDGIAADPAKTGGKTFPYLADPK